VYTLCVIDMQEYFGVNPNSTVATNVEREVYQAISDRAPILFVEYASCGDTLDRLTKITKEAQYDRSYAVTKKWDDGSKEIVSFARKNNVSLDRLKVVGINTDCCVYRTIIGLKAELPWSVIEVVADACDSYAKYSGSLNSHHTGVKLLKGLGCTISNYDPSYITPNPSP
jgi:nicotinamidase-related amidase